MLAAGPVKAGVPAARGGEECDASAVMPAVVCAAW